MRYPAERFCAYYFGFFITWIWCVGVECTARRTLLLEWRVSFTTKISLNRVLCVEPRPLCVLHSLTSSALD